MPLNIPDPFFKFKFAVQALPTFGGIVLPVNYVLHCSVPYPTLEAVPVYAGGYKRYFAGQNDNGQPTLGFYMDGEQKSLKYLNAWREAMVDKDGIYGLPVNYKRDIVVNCKDTRGNTNTQITIKNAWPATASGLDFDYSMSDKVVLDIQFSCDKIEIT